MVVTVAGAPSWASARAWSASAVMSGTSPLRTRTVASVSAKCGTAAFTASPVPLGSAWTASSTPSGRIGSSARSGPPTTTTFRAPAACAAAMAQRTIGRPQIGCRTFGVFERIRVPCPAARTTAIGASGMAQTRVVSVFAPRRCRGVKKRVPAAPSCSRSTPWRKPPMSTLASPSEPLAADRLLDLLDDRGLAGHAVAVAALAGAVCDALDIDVAETMQIQRAGLLHDVGKLALHADVLDSPGPLSSREWKLVRSHPQVGERLMLGFPRLADLAPLVRHHYQRWDGTGYPD